MQLGLIGLGKMGANMRTRLKQFDHEVVGYDPRPEVTDVESLADLAAALETPRVVWVMVPSGAPTRETVEKLADVLSPGDLVIEKELDNFVLQFECKTLGKALNSGFFFRCIPGQYQNGYVTHDLDRAMALAGSA